LHGIRKGGEEIGKSSRGDVRKQMLISGAKGLGPAENGNLLKASRGKNPCPAFAKQKKGENYAGRKETLFIQEILLQKSLRKGEQLHNVGKALSS